MEYRYRYARFTRDDWTRRMRKTLYLLSLISHFKSKKHYYIYYYFRRTRDDIDIHNKNESKILKYTFCLRKNTDFVLYVFHSRQVHLSYVWDWKYIIIVGIKFLEVFYFVKNNIMHIIYTVIV